MSIEDTISRISKIKGTFCYFTDIDCCFNNPKLRVFIPEGTRLDRCYFIQNNVEAFIDYPSISEENIIYLSREEIAGSHMLANVITVLSLEQYQVLVDFLKQNSTEAILRILRALNQVAQHPTKERNMFLEQLKTCSPQQIQTWLQRLSR